MSTALYIHATIVPINSLREVILDGALLIQGSTISAIGKTEEICSQTTEDASIKIIDCKNRIIIPGLINTHAHLAQSMLRVSPKLYLFIPGFAMRFGHWKRATKGKMGIMLLC